MPDRDFAARLAEIRSVIEQRQQAAGWSHPVGILAVTKGHDAGAVQTAASGGLAAVGENRVQEALAKQVACGDVPISWHLIGSMQRNKARQVVGRFALIHSVDRLDLAVELDRRTGDADAARQPVLVQVNCSREAQKGGVEPEYAEHLIESILGMEHLELRGLMTMAALTSDEREQRRTFAALRTLREHLATRGHVLPTLSMGMSSDYPAAIDEGSTLVRLGTALFGARP